ncbi:hypothetical protein ACIQUY_31940 [Streptomyces sp. NPDC090231]|uniref:hypothetical protein n=1 Tax=unclassified Streptomyces TaxID=2593676 RepID=UPI003820DBE9
MAGFVQAAVRSGTRVAGQDVVDLVVVDGDLGGGATAWADITGKPTTFPPAIGATASTAVAGNDARLAAGAAGTATVRALGTTGTTAAAGNDARLLTGTATAVNNSAAAPTQAEFNALLAALRTRGIITGS